MPIVSNQQININKILHFKCGKHYFEIEDKVVETCPWCKTELTDDDTIPDGDSIEKYIYTDPFTGELKITTEKKLDVLLNI